jgi:hypothetical protein
MGSGGLQGLQPLGFDVDLRPVVLQGRATAKPLLSHCVCTQFQGAIASHDLALLYNTAGAGRNDLRP